MGAGIVSLQSERLIAGGQSIVTLLNPLQAKAPELGDPAAI